jgi:pimeloyl-ACP methyl ester carboxylesterase
MVRSWLSRAAGQVASGLDQLFNDAVLGSPGSSLAHAERLAGLALFEAFYDRPELESALFPQPSAISPEVRRSGRTSDGGDLLELRWDSAFEPLWSDAALDACLEQIARRDMNAAAELRATAERLLPRTGNFAERYFAVVENRTVHARWYRHAGAPRPCAVLLHGYAPGALALEARVWPVEALYRGGLDVLLTVLPFHGPRRDPRRGLRPPAFPVAGDVRIGIEGMRQLVADHRALFDHLQRAGAPAIGVMGMSFGGYSAALLATLEARLQFAALLVPLAYVEPRAWNEPPLLGSVEIERERVALRRAQRVVSPFARASRVPSERCAVIAGELDRVTGVAQAEALASHLHAPLHRFAGGHILQLGRGRAFAHVYSMLERAGLMAR